MSRLRRLLNAEDDTSDAVEGLAEQCLERLSVFRPTSSVQLAITIRHLSQYHAKEPRLQDYELGILAIDSMSAFYWKDRHALEQLRDSPADSSNSTLPPNLLHYVVDALRHLRRSHRPVILMTNWGLNPVSKQANAGQPVSPFYRQHLHPFPAPFDSPQGSADALLNVENSQRRLSGNDLQTSDAARTPRDPETELTLPLHYHITLRNSPIDPFPASYSLADAINQEHMRAVLVEKAEIRGFVRTPGNDEVQEFTFRIGDREILVEEEDLPQQS